MRTSIGYGWGVNRLEGSKAERTKEERANELSGGGGGGGGGLISGDTCARGMGTHAHPPAK